VDDADAAYAKAKKAGARITQELVDRDYGSREFICLDPEGNVWSFGTYWPKAGEKA
ncbi:MAG: glyoxalase, partial [Mesorhizobium sp.]